MKLALETPMKLALEEGLIERKAPVKMTVDEGVRLVAGLFVMASVALGVWVNHWWFAFTVFVGANLFQSALTRWCPMMAILKRAGLAEHR